MCGIVGITSHTAVSQRIYEALLILQHRGEDAAGIATLLGCHKLTIQKGNGLVKNVFTTSSLKRLMGNTGIGHVRYPTTESTAAETQPFYVNMPYGVVLAYTGNIINAASLKADLMYTHRRHLYTESDSEVLLNIFAAALPQQPCASLGPHEVFEAVKTVYSNVNGAYACVALITHQGMVAFRDPHGIRPLVLGCRNEAGCPTEYMVASESAALDALDFTLVRDLRPGEVIYITLDGKVHTQQITPMCQQTPCLFEFVCFSRPDSIMEGVSIYDARREMGKKLGRRIAKKWSLEAIDHVIPVPDTSFTTAAELAAALGKPYYYGFVSNRYIEKTSNITEQGLRSLSVRRKFTPVKAAFAGKNVLIVDDSIVRGTTSVELIQMARDAGARNIYFASAAPAIAYSNVYGIEIPESDKLIAYGKTDDEIRMAIGADCLIFQDIDDLTAAIQQQNSSLTLFEASVFDGFYHSYQ